MNDEVPTKNTIITTKTVKEQNKDKIRVILKKLIPKYGLSGTAKLISKEAIPISYSTIRRWAIELKIPYVSRKEAKKLYNEGKVKKIIEKLDDMEKESNE